MYVRTLILGIILLSIGIACSGQSINETIDYINEKLKKYDYAAYLVQRMNSEFAPDWNISTHDELSITENGEVTIEQILVEEGERSVAKDVKFFLKSLSDSIEFSSGLDMYKSSYYTITIRCKTFGCMISTTTDDPTSEKMSSYTFSLSDKTYSERVANAIGRLIELSNEKAEYLEDDPFR